MKVVRLPALSTGRLYHPENIAGTHFCYRLNRPYNYSAAGKIMSMKNSNGTIGNRTRDFQACSTVLQPTAHNGLRHFATSRMVAGSIPDGVTGILH